MLSCKEEVSSLTKQLVNIESIVNTDGEKNISRELYRLISSYPYFTKNPNHVSLTQTKNDSKERYNVLAFVKGTKGNSSNTVLLIGHMDTVGIDDFNQLSPFATRPDELVEEFKKEVLSPLVREHAESGEWMFGRGSLDMKSGLASNIYLLKYYSEHPDELDGNLVFVSECDEEDSSNGILSALKDLKAWKEEHNFNYIGAINSDFVSPRYEGDENRYIYKGTVGKLLPSFFITGAETHVGSCFEGLDPNFLAAELTRHIDYNPDLCDEALGEIPAPPVSLKQMDLKPSYTVQTALSAYVYYNFFVHSWSPKEVLERLKVEATIAFQNALDLYTERYKKFCKMSGEPYKETIWTPRVFTFEEMNNVIVTEHGEAYLSHINTFKKELLLDDSLDVRMYAARVVEEAWKWMPDKSPAMIVFYSSVYSPRIALSGENENERNLISALDEAVEAVQPEYEHPIVVRNFFPYISDMSFVALNDDEEGITAITENNPSWGTKHYVEFQDIRDINVPIINIGPYGYDAHKKYERLEKKFSLEIVPNLTNEVIRRLIG
ncbi:M20/M25/M40 family metallo-hydrolase [Bacillus sp. BGMRC 2118]|nr:M20/M25/M40 family metallo-hydrolase [Bacillus sp. BGMRC 2118]